MHESLARHIPGLLASYERAGGLNYRDAINIPLI